MAHSFAEIAFTQHVQDEQRQHGSRRQYERVESFGPDNNRFGPDEKAFIESRDGVYLATVGETGWPYVQFRGGPKGFLRVLDEQTLGFADFRGNRQYITVGNLRTNDRVALFFMDYLSRTRLKMLGRAEVREATGDRELIEHLTVPGYRATVERAVLIHLAGFDWNCQQQHHTPLDERGDCARNGAVAPAGRGTGSGKCSSAPATRTFHTARISRPFGIKERRPMAAPKITDEDLLERLTRVFQDHVPLCA
jgi:predicted pyridoxine 5'-phosphate oxidase superfamily flavin-nucleotide-binding protein